MLVDTSDMTDPSRDSSGAQGMDVRSLLMNVHCLLTDKPFLHE